MATLGTVLSVATLRNGPAEDAACLAHLAMLQPGSPAAAATIATTTATAATHLSLRCGAVQVRWERHTEFYSFTFITDVGPTGLDRWLDTLPAGWLAALPGEMIAATQIALLPCPGEPPHVRSVAPAFGAQRDALSGVRPLSEFLDRRAGFQLRLQQTVEALSVLAMTHYGVGLGAYLLKPLAKAASINKSLVTMIAVPVIGLVVVLNLRRLRRRLVREPTSG